MSRIARHRRARVGLVLVALLLSLAMVSPAIAEDRTEAPNGRDLVQGLLLGSGRVAEALPEVFGKLPAQPKEAAAAEAALLDAVAKADPRLFARMERAVLSGDRYAVQETLDAASVSLHDVIIDGQLLEPELLPPYHYSWHPYRWHFTFDPFTWYYPYRFQPWKFDPWLYNPWFFELDRTSKLGNERFVNLVVERFAR